MPKRKIAVVDLLWQYPPAGGAGVDVIETFSRLQADYEVRLFCLQLGPPHPRGLGQSAATATPPLAVTAVQPQQATREAIVAAICAAVQSWQPDLVFSGDGWTLKPYLMLALAKEFPTITRLYAYEMLCPRNNERWPYDHDCNSCLLLDAERCLDCAAQYRDIIAAYRGPAGNPLTWEAQVARIWDGDYVATVKAALQRSCRVIVYNQRLADHLQARLDCRATVIAGGFQPKRFTGIAPRPRSGSRPLMIAVCGRMDDPAKGAEVAIAAGKLLVAQGLSIRMIVTRRAQPPQQYPWLEETGWLTQAQIAQLLARADVALVPSLWQEAFGMAWVEAMAMGLPVIASAVAGPQQFISHGRTGLLVPPGDAEALAMQLQQLADNEPLRLLLAHAGQQMVQQSFTWADAAQRLKTVIAAVLTSASPISP